MYNLNIHEDFSSYTKNEAEEKQVKSWENFLSFRVNLHFTFSIRFSVQLLSDKTNENGCWEIKQRTLECSNSLNIKLLELALLTWERYMWGKLSAGLHRTINFEGFHWMQNSFDCTRGGVAVNDSRENQNNNQLTCWLQLRREQHEIRASEG